MNVREFDTEIFQPEENRSGKLPFISRLAYTSYEINKLHEYVSGFVSDFPSLKAVDQLLVTTFDFVCKLDIADKKQLQDILTKLGNKWKRYEELLMHLSQDSFDYKILYQAKRYCLSCIAKNIDALEPEKKYQVNYEWQIIIMKYNLHLQD
ncbi:MAG: hypothetical protein H0W64_10170 [Gammaproteobacteria bacterium]|nr:hypothetical protein [Gammaproteobacteria bacterium]